MQKIVPNQSAPPVAFFDIDGTVFRSSLLIALVDRLIEEKIFPAEARDVYYEAYIAWQNRTGTYDVYIQAVIETFLRHLQGVHYGEFADVGKRVVSVQRQRVYRYTRDLIEQLRKEGYFIVAISHSPKTVLDEFCRMYGFDKVYGRIYEIGPQDRFTGNVVDEHMIANKAAIVNRVQQGSEVDMARSVAVGDTDGDIPLLESVAEPICFNPNKILYEHARRRGWRIVVERKDMIYTI